MEIKKTYKFMAGGHEHVVDLDAVFSPPDGVADLEYHKFLSSFYATISDLRGLARTEMEAAKLATEAEFNRLYLWFTEHFEAQAKRPTREFLRACVETQQSWIDRKQAEMQADKNYRDAISICDALWFHSKLVMAVTAGVAETIANEIKGGRD